MALSAAPGPGTSDRDWPRSLPRLWLAVLALFCACRRLDPGCPPSAFGWPPLLRRIRDLRSAAAEAEARAGALPPFRGSWPTRTALLLFLLWSTGGPLSWWFFRPEFLLACGGVSCLLAGIGTLPVPVAVCLGSLRRGAGALLHTLVRRLQFAMLPWRRSRRRTPSSANRVRGRDWLLTLFLMCCYVATLSLTVALLFESVPGAEAAVLRSAAQQAPIAADGGPGADGGGAAASAAATAPTGRGAADESTPPPPPPLDDGDPGPAAASGSGGDGRFRGPAAPPPPDGASLPIGVCGGRGGPRRRRPRKGSGEPADDRDGGSDASARRENASPLKKRSHRSRPPPPAGRRTAEAHAEAEEAKAAAKRRKAAVAASAIGEERAEALQAVRSGVRTAQGAGREIAAARAAVLHESLSAAARADEAPHDDSEGGGGSAGSRSEREVVLPGLQSVIESVEVAAGAIASDGVREFCKSRSDETAGTRERARRAENQRKRRAGLSPAQRAEQNLKVREKSLERKRRRQLANPESLDETRAKNQKKERKHRLGMPSEAQEASREKDRERSREHKAEKRRQNEAEYAKLTEEERRERIQLNLKRREQSSTEEGKKERREKDRERSSGHKAEKRRQNAADHAKRQPLTEEQKKERSDKNNSPRKKRREQEVASHATTWEDVLGMSVMPAWEWYHDFQQQATKALMLFLCNSGHCVLPALIRRLPRNDPSLLATSWSGLSVDPGIEELLEAFNEQVITPELKASRLEAFKRAFDLEAPLISCGCCGERNYVNEADERKPVEYSLDDEMLHILRLNDGQVQQNTARRQLGPQFDVASVYQHRGDMLHLHPHLVSESADDGGARVFVCSDCATKLAAKKLPPWSIAEGHDYGNVARLPGRLSILERTILAKCVCFGMLVKLNGSLGAPGRSVLKGNVIAFPHSGPKILETLKRANATKFPFHTNEEICDIIKVSFVGPEGERQRAMNVLSLPGPSHPLCCRTPLLLEWLTVLKEINPMYQDVDIDSLTQEGLDKRFKALQEQIIEEVHTVSNDVSRHIDETSVGEDVARVRDPTCDENNDDDGADPPCAPANSPDHADPSGVPIMEFQTAGPDDDEDGRQGDDDYPALIMNSCCILKEAPISTLTVEDLMSKLNDVLNTERANCDDAGEPIPVQCRREAAPMNEFGENDRLMLACFPCLFPFGRGVKAGSSGLNDRFTRHLLLQHSNAFADDMRFYFLNFNQRQRHATALAASLRVKANTDNVRRLAAVVNADNFRVRLASATANPDSEDAKLIAKQILPHLSSIGAKTPFSNAARSASFGHLMASMHRFGLGHIFITMSFNDTNNPISIRLTFESKRNDAFPAVDGGLRAHMARPPPPPPPPRAPSGSGGADADADGPGEDADAGISSSFVDIPISEFRQARMLKRMAENPVASTEYFRLLFNAIVTALLGMPCNTTLKTTPINHPDRRGIFGALTDFNANIETSQKGALHFHGIAIGPISPSVIGAVAHSPVFMEAVRNIFDSQIEAETNPRFHLENYMFTEHPGGPRIFRSNFAAMTPILNEFSRSVIEESVSKTGMHSRWHVNSCVKCSCLFCRYYKPSCLADETGIRLVEKVLPFPKDPRSKDFALSDVPECEETNFGSDPIPAIDNRPITFQIRRRELVWTNADGQELGRDDDFDIADCLDSPPFEHVDEVIKARIRALSPEERSKIKDALWNANGFMTEFNDVLVLASHCNMAIYPMGTGGAAKALFIYVCSYLAKNPTEIRSLLSLLYDAAKHNEKYPSGAADSGTSERNTIYFVQRVLNSLHGTQEFSNTQATAAELGVRAEYQSHQCTYLFASAALRYCIDSHLSTSGSSSDSASGGNDGGSRSRSESDPNDASAGSQSDSANPDVIPDSESECDADRDGGAPSSDEPEDPGSKRVARSSRPPGPRHAAGQTSDPAPGPRRRKSHRSKPAPESNHTLLNKHFPANMNELDEFGPIVADAPADQPAEADPPGPSTMMDKIDKLLDIHAIKEGSMAVIVAGDGKLKVVFQHQDYHYRHDDLKHYSLYEFACCTRRVKKVDTEAENKKALDGSKSNPRGAGRHANATFEFKKGHPLQRTHQLQLLSKQTIAMFIPRVPPYPPPQRAGRQSRTDAWMKTARNFAAFALVVYKPWSDPPPPESLTWKFFCDWVRDLRDSDAIIDRTRLEWITIVAHNLRFTAAVSKMVNQHRGSEATRWTEQKEHLPSKLALNCERTPGQFTANDVAHQAQLASQSLLHLASMQSVAEEKTNSMIAEIRTNLSDIFSFEDGSAPLAGAPSQRESLATEDSDMMANTTGLVNMYTDKTVADVASQNKEDAVPEPSKGESGKKGRPEELNRPTIITWSEEQKRPIEEMNNYIQKLQLWSNEMSRIGTDSGKAPPFPPPPRIMILGGPGSGKTAVISELTRLLTDASIPILSSAMTGIAAGGMPNGQTIHSTYTIPVRRGHQQRATDYLTVGPSQATRPSKYRRECSRAMGLGLPVATIIDEVSLLTCAMLGQILGRYDEFLQEGMIPGPFIFVGDFFQIPPITGTPIYKTILESVLVDRPSRTGGIDSPEYKAIQFLRSTQLFRFDRQQRSTNAVHTANINTITTMNPNDFPFTKTLMDCYHPFTANDVRDDPLWDQAPVIVGTNAVRHEINLMRLIAFAKKNKTCILAWQNPLTSESESDSARHLPPAMTQQLYTNHRALTGYFCPGVTSYVIDNISTSKSIVNGAHCTQHSITLASETMADQIELNRIQGAMAVAVPGQIVWLQRCPLSVNVEISNADLTAYSPGDTLVPGRAVVPIPLGRFSRHESIKPHETTDPLISNVGFRSIGIELGFAITFQKAQGRTIQRVILDLNRWPSGKLTFEMVLVGMTRVRDLDHFRILPLLQGQSLKHIYKLQPNRHMLAFFAGYTDPDTGLWDVAAAKRAFEKLGLSKSKRKKPDDAVNFSQSSSSSSNSESDSKQRTSAVPAEDTASVARSHAPVAKASRTKTADSLSKSNNANHETSASNSKASKSTQNQRRSRSFTLSRRQLVDCETLKAKRQFRSFEVSGDGNCMFSSLIHALHLDVTPQQLRIHMIDRLQQQNAHMRICGLNEHMIRESDVRNTYWKRYFEENGTFQLHVEGADGDIEGDIVGSPDFTEAWNRYVQEMSGRAYAGLTEITICAMIYNVNIALWSYKTATNTADFIITCPLSDASPAQRTIHLLNMDNIHYENTNIPETFRPVPEDISNLNTGTRSRRAIPTMHANDGGSSSRSKPSRASRISGLSSESNSITCEFLLNQWVGAALDRTSSVLIPSGEPSVNSNALNLDCLRLGPRGQPQRINADIIEAYMKLIEARALSSSVSTSTRPQPRMHFMHPQFFVIFLGHPHTNNDDGQHHYYQNVKRWMRGTPLAELDLLFFPINTRAGTKNSHWILGVAHLDKMEIRLYDSYFSTCDVVHHRYMDALQEYMTEEAKEQGFLSFNGRPWTKVFCAPPKIPPQTDNTSCALFVLSAMDCISTGNEPDGYSQDDMPEFRSSLLHLLELQSSVHASQAGRFISCEISDPNPITHGIKQADVNDPEDCVMQEVRVNHPA